MTASGVPTVVATASATVTPASRALITATALGMVNRELGPGVPDVHVGQGAADVVAAREQEVVGLGGVDLGVVVPDPVDRPGVDDVLDRALQHPDIGDQAEEEHRREHGQGDRVEELAQRGPLGDQGQGDQGAR